MEPPENRKKYLETITLNVNSLNLPFKWQRLSGQCKQHIQLRNVYKRNTSHTRTQKGWEWVSVKADKWKAMRAGRSGGWLTTHQFCFLFPSTHGSCLSLATLNLNWGQNHRDHSQAWLLNSPTRFLAHFSSLPFYGCLLYTSDAADDCWMV